MTYTKTKLWQSTLAALTGIDPDEALRARLRVSLVRFREHAEQIAAEIPLGIRELTVHDVPKHIDALWQIADIVVGESYVLTPIEGYVLGGAFLLHDLGLALASYPNGIEDLKKLPLWRVTAAQLWRQRNGVAPSDEEISDLD